MSWWKRYGDKGLCQQSGEPWTCTHIPTRRCVTRLNVGTIGESSFWNIWYWSWYWNGDCQNWSRLTKCSVNSAKEMEPQMGCLWGSKFRKNTWRNRWTCYWFCRHGNGQISRVLEPEEEEYSRQPNQPGQNHLPNRNIETVASTPYGKIIPSNRSETAPAICTEPMFVVGFVE